MKIRKINFLSKISTIHGLSYIGDGKASRFSKLFWISAFVCSFLGCFFFFLQVYEKVFVVPDISITIGYRKLNEFPFPAITICPHNKFPHTTINYKENLLKIKRAENVSKLIEAQIEVALQSCQLGVYDLEDVELNISSEHLVYNLSQYQYFIDDMIPVSCFDTCSESSRTFYSRFLTFQGFCASFNLMNFDEIFTKEMSRDFFFNRVQSELSWDLTNGYSNNESDYPYRMSNGNYKSFDAILLQDNGNVDKDCSGFRRGYEVYWHLPNEVLTHWHSSININNINKDNQIYLRTKSFKMSPELQKYNVKYRQCYFDGEKKLKFFKIYTEKNCKFECLANFTLNKHGCVRYFMPRDKSTPLCTSKDLQAVSFTEIDFEDNADGHQCDCYPPCNNIQYELFSWAEINLLPDMNFGEHFDFRRIRNIDFEDELKDFDRTRTTSFSIKAVKEKVEERTSFSAYQMQQFISDFGGLLSLAMGCSILSIVELIYNAFNIKNEPEDETEEKVEEKGYLSETQL
ncbi:unnamed protein product [Chironomus riparius]|uniref:Uncharacterized protein n=2 Tax=Chironomus riparius TaxID=315576 RepID=A0A9P0NNF2_9DIPT|nr:unnamed protein product [Chironomus riparius]